MARNTKASYCDHPDQYTLFDRLRKPRKNPQKASAPASKAPAPIIATPTPTQPQPKRFLRQVVSSGIEWTGGVVKEGTRDAAVYGVKWLVTLSTAAAGGVSGYYMWQTPSAALPPSQIETGTLPQKPTQTLPLKDVGTPPTTAPQSVQQPRVKGRSALSKGAGKKTTTRIFILEDVVDWLKQAPTQ